MEEEDFFDVVLKILGNKTRRLMLELLSERPRFLSDISKELQIGQQAILRHIDEFTKAGILEELEDQPIDEKKIGRRPKYYKIAEKKRIIIDLTPDRFNVDLMDSFLEEGEEAKDELDLKFCKDLTEIEKAINIIEQVTDPNKRLIKIKQMEDDLQGEINGLIDAKHYAEILLKKLDAKKHITERYLGKT